MMDDILDRLAVAAVIDRYFAGIDRCDQPMIRTCFADEATYRSDAGVLDMDGGDAIGSRLGRGGRFAFTSHIRSSQTIELEGDRAKADTMALAYLVIDATPGGAVMVRGLRYTDELLRRNGGWQILHRHHSTQWQYQTVCAELMRV
jgi:hypothetical protein